MNLPKMTVDNEVQAAYISLTKNSVASTVVVTDNIIIDFDDNGQIIGIEIMNSGKVKENVENSLQGKSISFVQHQ
jgi:uncharacterized protein YuzE